MSTVSLCIGLNSRVCDLSMLAAGNITTVQIGDLSLTDSVSDYTRRLLSQVSAIEKYNVRKALLLPLVAPEGDQGKMERIIKEACDAGVDEIVANSLGEILTVRRLHANVTVTASDFVCCYCGQDGLVLKDYGVSRVRLSPEMSFAQVSALASNSPLALQAVVHGHITLGVLQEFSRREAFAERNGPFSICAETGGETLFQVHGTEIVSERRLDLLGQVSDFHEIGVSDFFIDARFLDNDDIGSVCDAFASRLAEMMTRGNDARQLGVTKNPETENLLCNGWFYGKAGIGDSR